MIVVDRYGSTVREHREPVHRKEQSRKSTVETFAALTRRREIQSQSPSVASLCFAKAGSASRPKNRCALKIKDPLIACKSSVASSKMQVVRESIRTGLGVRVCQEGEEGNFKPCLIEDEGGPLEAAMQVEASNHRKLLW